MSEIAALIPGVTWGMTGNGAVEDDEMVVDAVCVVRTVDSNGEERLYAVTSATSSDVMITGMLWQVLNGGTE